ncbi:MAG TPA: TldD/PmbA family protein [Bryobacteraceae bacterium]|nr:TldD/PmbA family protein [Bryobacteraceae bacterium]
MTDQEARDWFDIVTREARALGVHDVETHFSEGESSLTRFANNAIHQNVSELSRSISIRVAIGQRTARATTNRLDRIREATQTAVALARASAPDENLLPLYVPEPATPIDRWDEATAAFSPMARAEAVREAIACVEGAGHVAAGIFSTERGSQILANSNGLFLRHDETGSTFSITATGSDSSGWAKASAVRAGDLRPLALAQSAAEKATRSAKPRRLEPGRYRVLLEPSAVLDLVGQIFGDCTATAVAEERSFLTGRMDEALFGENITIHDDVRHPLQDGAPFDGEGVPRQPLTLFAEGRPADLACSRTAARQAGRTATGHGLALPNESGECVQNIVIAGGSETREELLRKLGRGVLVTRLWYIREVDPFRKVMTGMTRDGTFLVEDGEIVGGLHNFRFNESVVEMLRRVEAMSPSERACGEEAFDMVVPAMLVRDFPFTEVTLF